MRADKRKADQLSDINVSGETKKKRSSRSVQGCTEPTFTGSSIPQLIALAQSWDENQDPTGFLMSEKLDGMRAMWDGQADLWSRAGHKVMAPDWFKKDLPQGMVLDGELFLGRAQFQNLMKICRKNVPDQEAWEKVRFVVFDAPLVGGGLQSRLQVARELAFNNSDELPFARLHPQTVCQGHEHLQRVLAEVQSKGGEGLMLRKAEALHRAGRTPDLLKVKTQAEDEALVVGHQPGKGKHVGRLGALQVITRQGKAFKIGTGLTDAQRARPPPKGAVVTFKYMELTTGGIPRHPAFFRIRPDVDRSEFP
jgi:DNA ligase-1